MLSIRLSAFGAKRRGQAIIFAALSVVLLAFFVALVYNLGRVTERRVAIQIAADSAAHSGAMVMANSLSSIAWINDGMAQIHSRLIRYVVDVNTTAVLAELENRQRLLDDDLNPIPLDDTPAADAYIDAVKQADEWIPRGKEWLRDLSRIQHTIALVTPRLMQETMFETARENGAERISIYPTTRLLPHKGDRVDVLVQYFENEGWRAIHQNTGDFIDARLDHNGNWNITHNQSGVTQERIVIIEADPGERWIIQSYDHNDVLQEEITIIWTEDFGWIVAGWTPEDSPSPPSGPREPGLRYTFERVDMTGDGVYEGTRITDIYGNSRIFRLEGGVLYVWNPSLEQYEARGGNTMDIRGIPVRVNVSGDIHFRSGTRVSLPRTPRHPLVVSIGRATIILRDPPYIITTMGPIRIEIRGFNINDFGISVRGRPLHLDSADNIWRQYYDENIDLWWRHKLRKIEHPVYADREWDYTYELIGAHLLYEGNIYRFAIENGILAGMGPGHLIPEWLDWFNVLEWRNPAPYELTYKQDHFEPYWPPGKSINEPLFRPFDEPPPQAYYRTKECLICSGEGYITVGTQGEKIICPVCEAKDHDGDGRSDIRVFLADAAGSAYLAELRGSITPPLNHPNETFMSLRIFDPSSYGVVGFDVERNRPLVLSEEFFRFGINVGAWRGKEISPMLFNREPEWGMAAVASARVAVPIGNIHNPYYLVNFMDPYEREYWIDNAPENLYRTSLEARLVSTRNTIQGFDLESANDSPASYLYTALLLRESPFVFYEEAENMLDADRGQRDYEVPRLLENMQDRRGRRLDIRDPNIEAVIHH